MKVIARWVAGITEEEGSAYLADGAAHLFRDLPFTTHYFVKDFRRPLRSGGKTSWTILALLAAARMQCEILPAL
jgi:hypothetical protein